MQDDQCIIIKTIFFKIGEEPELEIDLSSALMGIEPNSASHEKQQDRIMIFFYIISI